MRLPSGVGRTRRRRPPIVVGGLVLAGAVLTVALLLPAVGPAAAGDTLAGSQGTDVSLPATDSTWTTTVTTGQGAGIHITVNQTQNLNHQAISVTWTGGKPTDDFSTSGGNKFLRNFLQMFQCWGDDANGPRPDQCEFGAHPGGGGGDSRVLGTLPPGTPVDPSQGYLDPNGVLWRPFVGADGGIVNGDSHPLIPPIILPNGSAITTEWQNRYYDHVTTNEDTYAVTHADGTGSELLTVDTGIESTGLGCGVPQSQPDGSQVTHKCWLVIVPRQDLTPGAPPGPPAAADPPGLQGAGDSPLSNGHWSERVVVPLGFNPVADCGGATAARRIVGSELVAAAAQNWGRKLCSPPYHYAAISDATARQQLVSTSGSPPGMAVVSQPISAVDPANPVTYAPVALSGLVVGYNIQRNANTDLPEDPAMTRLHGVRVAHINLTPRLVAKLLTLSYPSQFLQLRPAQPPSGYGWLKTNPDNLFKDKDFLQFNPEFTIIGPTAAKNDGGLVVSFSSSDAAHQLWRWVLADPEASSWLAGQPDNNSPPMKVNPYYSTDPHVNPSGGAFGDPVPDRFPKSDPYSYQDTSAGDMRGDPPQSPKPLYLTDIVPYANSTVDVAQRVRAANDGAKTSHDDSSPTQQTPDTFWGPDGPQPFGRNQIMGVTDAASAARFGLQTASLSRAGDDAGPAGRTFVTPGTAGFLAGEAAMVPGPGPALLEIDPAHVPADAYPLTTLSYAAVAPANLDKAARNDYAGFVTYAAGDGQVPGVGAGQLPPGYAPLPKALRDQATAAANMIRTFVAPSPATTVPPAATPGTPRGTAAAGRATVTTTASTSPQPGLPAALTAPVPPTKAPGGPRGVAGVLARTAATAIGTIRYTLPVALAIGLIAAGGACFLRRRHGSGVGPPVPPGSPPVAETPTG